ncbi:hypothetical protein BpHYR1_022307 [Brachionus plicatilis]|uniref:Uncharacterized protein n=1 Tax=Brachionus plicatilis TaxID=10195 RepID=A0A3M7REH6_BRAPC|nr:hypothetical protein BpHYR1_022307 [Brachionus plicatilis]
MEMSIEYNKLAEKPQLAQFLLPQQQQQQQQQSHEFLSSKCDSVQIKYVDIANSYNTQICI